MSSTAGDFRLLTPLVVMGALKDAGTVVCEPMHRIRLEVPADTLGALLPTLTKLGGIPDAPAMNGALCVVEGVIPAARVNDMQLALPGLTRGEGVLEYTFGRYEPVHGVIPTRVRSDYNPLNRKEYLLHVLRRV